MKFAIFILSFILLLENFFVHLMPVEKEIEMHSPIDTQQYQQVKEQLAKLLEIAQKRYLGAPVDVSTDSVH